MIPVLKSNAYGHGIKQVAQILKSRKPPYLAVDGYYEGLKIREISNQKILIMGMIRPENFESINPSGFAFSVHDIETIKAMKKSNKKYLVHIEIDTGMSRHGVRTENLKHFVNLIKQCKNIHIDGVMTHLADADNPNDNQYTQLQTKRFDESVKIIKEAGFNPKYIHIAQSAGSTKVNSEYANAIRTGLALYGINPLDKADKYSKVLSNLVPVLSLTSTVSKIQKINPGESVSYNRTFIAKKETTVGILPIGYYEGIPRSLSNTGNVIVNNKSVDIIGRVCMNHMMIDISDTVAKVGDEVIIISNNPKINISLEKICNTHRLFNYGLLAGLSGNIRRTIID